LLVFKEHCEYEYINKQNKIGYDLKCLKNNETFKAKSIPQHLPHDMQGNNQTKELIKTFIRY